jgi:vacuolar protein sorting-associated protein VTA1
VHVENFILSVFAQTDKDERTCEQITKKNAVDFKRSCDFIQLLDLFEEGMTEEWSERRKYCIYKAGTIMKALKNGEQPERGNPFAPPEEEKKEEEMP